MKGFALFLIAALAGCADVTPHKTYRGVAVYGPNGEQIGIDGIKERPMTHAEAKEAGFNFWQRNSDLPWIWPFAVIDALNQIRS